MFANITFNIIRDCIIHLDTYLLLSFLKCGSELSVTSKIVRDEVSRERVCAGGGEGPKGF